MMVDDLVLVPGYPGTWNNTRYGVHSTILPVEVAVVKFPRMISVEVLLHWGVLDWGFEIGRINSTLK